MYSIDLILSNVIKNAEIFFIAFFSRMMAWLEEKNFVDWL